MVAIFCSPARYVQGQTATAELGAQLTYLGLTGPALIIASPRAIAELESVWHTTLTDGGVSYAIHEFGGECSQQEIDAGVVSARAAGAKVVIGVGGGKTLDTSRAVASEIDAAMVNCPTIASSDAPCSALSVIYQEDGSFSRLQFYPRNPELVLVDTSLVAAAPRRYLVAGMGDALATWYEARTVIEAHGRNQVAGSPTLAGRALAELCCRTLYADGPAAASAVDVGAVTPALERITEANTLLSGLGFESGGLAIAHSVHNGLTQLPPTHDFLHGEKVAFGLLVQLVVEGRPSSEFEQVRQFCRTVGLPTTLADIGLADVDAAGIDVVAERAVAPGETAHNEPFPVTASMIADGIRAADELTRVASV